MTENKNNSPLPCKMKAWWKERTKKRKRPRWLFYHWLLRQARLKRNVIIATLSILAVGLFFLAESHKISKEESIENVRVEVDDGEKAYWKNVNQIKLALAKVEIYDWELYQNNWYGFEIKYPSGWARPASRGATSGAKWEYRYEFRKQKQEEEHYVGFDVIVYNIKKTEDIFATEEFPPLKDEKLKDDPKCKNIKWGLIESGDYPAEEIHIGKENDCYDPALFFSLTRENYIYNFVAVSKEVSREIEDPMDGISDGLPQFFAAVSTINLIDIKRPPRPKFTAPKPVSFKMENGRMVCAKKNDKPSKSKKGKGKHLDMECCLDPDEYPNPWCYYDPNKYGKYL